MKKSGNERIEWERHGLRRRAKERVQEVDQHSKPSQSEGGRDVSIGGKRAQRKTVAGLQRVQRAHDLGERVPQGSERESQRALPEVLRLVDLLCIARRKPTFVRAATTSADALRISGDGLSRRGYCIIAEQQKYDNGLDVGDNWLDRGRQRSNEMGKSGEIQFKQRKLMMTQERCKYQCLDLQNLQVKIHKFLQAIQ